MTTLPIDADLRGITVLQATTLPEKLNAALSLMGVELDEAQHEALFERLQELEDELDKQGKGFRDEARAGLLRFHQVRIGAVLPFPKHVVFDLRELPGEVVALVGPNGGGKSVLAESMLLGAYRRMPTRGGLGDVAEGPARVEVDLVAPTGPFTTKQGPEAPRVFDAKGFCIAKSAKDFAAWQRAHLPSLALVQATTFGVQGGMGHLLSMGPAEAKDLLLALTGGDVYPRLAAIAAKRARAVELDIAHLGGAAEEQRSIAASLGEGTAILARLKIELSDAERAVEEARVRAEQAQAPPPSTGPDATRKREELRDVARRTNALETEIHGIDAWLVTHADSARAADASIPALEERRARLRAEVDAGAARERDGRDDTIPQFTSRISRLRAALVQIKERPRGAARLAEEALGADDSAAGAHQEMLANRAAESDKLTALLGDLSELDEHLNQTRAAAAKLPTVLQSQGRIVALRAERASFLAREEALAAEIHALEEQASVEPSGAAAHAAAHDELKRKSDALEQIRRRAAAAEARVEQGERARDRSATLQAQHVELRDTAASWRILEKAFGRAGIQAYEVEAVGPAIAEEANALLDACVPGRWTLTVQTTSPTQEGERETFEVSIYDHRHKRAKSAKGLSPGERVLVGEAIAGALSKIAQKKGPPGEAGTTIVRDETAWALDHREAKVWVTMLRREAKALGANKVLIISHDNAVLREVDAKLLVADGAIRLMEKNT